MTLALLLLATLACEATARYSSSSGCLSVRTIDRNLKDHHCDQPLFVTFLPKTEENKLLDNVCYTYFPLPDDPNTYEVYVSRVFCDGSTDVTSHIATDIEMGVSRHANPYCTYTDQVFGYAGCDTYLQYRCNNYGSCDYSSPYIFGLSPLCHSIGLSCLRKVEEIVSDNCLPDIDYYVLPMKLPNRCVTTQICTNTPTSTNQFHKALGFSGVSHFYSI